MHRRGIKNDAPVTTFRSATRESPILPPLMPTPTCSKLDLNQLAKRMLDEAIGDAPKTKPPAQKNAATVEAGKVGGKKGGASRAAKLTAEQRSEIAKKAAAGRWKRKANQ